MVSVTESEDYAYFAELLSLPEAAIIVSTRLCRYYLVRLGNNSKGGFVIIDKSPFPPELHTHLQLTGMNALVAFKQLIGLLRDHGTRMLTTFAPNESRAIRLAACIAGFHKVRQDSEYTFYEMAL